MATITELLQDRVDEKATTNAIWEIRSLLQSLEAAAQLTAAQITAIVNDNPAFAGVHQDLRDEGQSCRILLNQFINALDGHADFINFTPG